MQSFKCALKLKHNTKDLTGIKNATILEVCIERESERVLLQILLLNAYILYCNNVSHSRFMIQIYEYVIKKSGNHNLIHFKMLHINIYIYVHGCTLHTSIYIQCKCMFAHKMYVHY